jgi:hypothetical protein
MHIWLVHMGGGGGKASILQCPFHRDYRSVVEDVVITNKISYSNSNDSDEFPLAWTVPARDTITFHSALRCYFVSKTIKCFWRSLYMKDVQTNGGY